MPSPIRPVFSDRLYGNDGYPTFDTSNPRLPQLTPVIQEGTHHNSGMMNNLFVFDNLIAMSGTEYTTTGWKTKKFTETITEAEADEETGIKRVIATRVWEEASTNNWTVTEELYDINLFGQNVVIQKRIMTMRKNGADWEANVL